MQPTPHSPRSVVICDLERSHQNTSSHGGNTVLFPWKLHEMLQSTVTDGKCHIVSWLPHGTAFKVHNVPVFVSEILPLFFKQTKYKSFQRQLNLWGFERIQNGPEKGAYLHKHFLRGKPSLCSKLTRQRAKKAPPFNSIKSSKKPLLTKSKKTKLRKLSSVPSKVQSIPRRVSEGSFDKFSQLTDIVETQSLSDKESWDLAEFEGFTFHLLEHDRYEELNTEFKFTTSPESHCERIQIRALLEELERGVFGMPKAVL